MTSESATPELGGEPAELDGPHEVLFLPDWVPDTGHSLAKVGVYFGVIRIPGERGLEVAELLDTQTTRRPGAIIHRTRGEQVVHFLTEPGAGEGLRWPPGVSRLGVSRDDYVSVPALTGDTDPVAWWSPPRHQSVFVDPTILHAVVCQLTHWPTAAKAVAT
ncbi:hypothetical protein [Streptomyces sp. NPDC051561]|uniref:hypothetical protein n=1 Tax=Streptomyces sp. NPDC051561 TaxID=3365658 RepID=UPI0037BB44AE